MVYQCRREYNQCLEAGLMSVKCIPIVNENRSEKGVKLTLLVQCFYYRLPRLFFLLCSENGVQKMLGRHNPTLDLSIFDPTLILFFLRLYVCNVWQCFTVMFYLHTKNITFVYMYRMLFRLMNFHISVKRVKVLISVYRKKNTILHLL